MCGWACFHFACVSLITKADQETCEDHEEDDDDDDDELKAATTSPFANCSFCAHLSHALFSLPSSVSLSDAA